MRIIQSRTKRPSDEKWNALRQLTRAANRWTPKRADRDRVRRASRRYYAALGAVIAATATFGCGGRQGGAALQLQLAAQPIIGGQADPGHPAVVAVLNDVQSYGCTGTFIDPTTILTAAHCVADPNPADYQVAGGADVTQASFIAAVRLVAADPRWVTAGDAFDVGVVIVDPTQVTYAPNAKLPAPMRWVQAPDDAAVAPGAAFTQVGYGEDVQSGGTFGVKRAIDATVTSSSSARFSYGNASAGACFGDSGGPAIAAVAGTASVLGVMSYITGPTGTPCTESTDMRADSDAAFVQQFLGLVSIPTPTPSATATATPAPAARGGCEVHL